MRRSSHIFQLLLLPTGLTLRCYSGLDTDYEVTRKPQASKMIQLLQELDCRSQCQGTPCLCVKADPVAATWTDPATSAGPGQFSNQGQGGLFPGQGNQGQGVEYEGVDGQVHTYYPVSSGRGRAGERVEARLPTYSQQWEANERRSPRIVNQASTTLRQCWPNPFGAEREGCSLQYYHSALYNICRCSGDLCNGGLVHQPHLSAFIAPILLYLAIF